MKELLGYQLIIDEGRVEARRADILANLEERFGPEAAARVADAVNALTDEALMDRLHRLAVRCANIEEFQRALAEAQAPPRPAPRPRRTSNGRK